MQLYLMRHGVAVPRGTKGFSNDGHRPLSAEGLRKTRKIARGLAALNPRLDLILTSPCVRAKQTADIVAEALDAQRLLRLCPQLVPGVKPRDLVKVFEGLGQGARRVLLIGHEPDLSQLASLWISGGSRVSLDLKKGGLCRIEVETLRAGHCGTLEWVLTPRLLMRLA